MTRLANRRVRTAASGLAYAAGDSTSTNLCKGRPLLSVERPAFIERRQSAAFLSLFTNMTFINVRFAMLQLTSDRAKGTLKERQKRTQRPSACRRPCLVGTTV